MVTPGSFPELSKILDAVQRANPITDDDDDNEDDFSDDGRNDAERMLGLPGVPGEARVKMLGDELLEQLRETAAAGQEEPPDRMDDDDDDEEDDNDESEDDPESDQDEISLPALPPVHRQTFVFSATLTLPHSGGNTKKKGKKGRALQDVDGAIAEILQKARAVGQTKIVDLTNGAAASKTKGTTSLMQRANGTDAARPTESKFRLPPGLQLQQIKCTQLHKDSHLYSYLLTTVSGSSGPALVFCNSIAAVRRVGMTLQTLGLPVRMLHAHMQQVRSF